MSIYADFKSELMEIINDNHSIDELNSILADYIYSSKFCIFLVRSIARKFELDYEDLRSELISEILAGKFFKQLINNNQFSRQVFYLNIKKIAIKMVNSNDKLLLVDEIKEEELVRDSNLLNDYVSRNAILKYIELRQANLKRLIDYRSELMRSPIVVSKFQKNVDLNISEILVMLKKYRISRHSLLNNPDKYRKYFLIIIDRYLELFVKYQDVMNVYLDYLKKKTGTSSIIELYEKLKPAYSYLNFTRKIRNLSLWEIEELDNLLIKVNCHA